MTSWPPSYFLSRDSTSARSRFCNDCQYQVGTPPPDFDIRIEGRKHPAITRNKNSRTHIDGTDRVTKRPAGLPCGRQCRIPRMAMVISARIAHVAGAEYGQQKAHMSACVSQRKSDGQNQR